MADARSPTIRRRELGALLRTMRTEAGMTVEHVAESLLCAPSTISRLETGQRSASPRDIRDLCNLYGVTDPAIREHLNKLAREGRKQAWWQPYDLPYATYVGLEAGAVSISDFEPSVFPGLLWLPEYARAVYEGALPPLSDAVIRQRIEVRKTRQAILTREDPPPARLEAIVDEAVLHRPIGGRAVMAAQLGHVIRTCELPNVTVRVLEFGTGAHPALDSTFILMHFAPPVPAVVYVEGLVGRMYVERAPDVERYERVFQRLGELAMSPADSVSLMARMRAGYRPD